MSMQRIDRNSGTWQVIKAWAEDQRQGEIERLIGGATPEQDERIRGRIQALGNLLDLPDDPTA
jgi:hypothetical protein